MPRGRRANVEYNPDPINIQDIGGGSQTIHLVSPQQILAPNIIPTKFMVAEYLKNSYFDMSVECNKKLDCPVCLEAICCKRCFSMLPCGHYYHLNCLIKLDKCALCRDSQ